MTLTPPRLSVLVPIYNNETTLEPLVDRLRATLREVDYEIVLVNDGSRDGSLGVLRRLSALEPRLKVISFSRNFGQHPAIAAALDFARGEILVLMDADLEDLPEQVPLLVDTLTEQGCDVVYTTKDGAASTVRTLTSDAYHQAFSRSVGISLPRQLGTFRAFTRKVRDALRQFPERHVLYGPLMFYVGFRHVTIPVTRGVRPGRSSYTFTKRLHLAINSLVTYSDLPPKIFAVVGTAMVALPLTYAAVVLLQYLLTGRTLPRGLTIVVLLLLLLNGIVMLSIGVLGVYLFRVFQEVLARPRYLVDETLNCGHDGLEGSPQ